jgi:hypothetical protein
MGAKRKARFTPVLQMEVPLPGVYGIGGSGAAGFQKFSMQVKHTGTPRPFVQVIYVLRYDADVEMGFQGCQGQNFRISPFRSARGVKN